MLLLSGLIMYSCVISSSSAPSTVAVTLCGAILAVVAGLCKSAARSSVRALLVWDDACGVNQLEQDLGERVLYFGDRWGCRM
jgi:hypothetical protein